MRQIVDNEYVVGFFGVPVERRPAAGDEGTSPGRAHRSDRLLHQLRRAWRDHAAEANVDGRGALLQECPNSRVQCPGFVEHPCIGAHRTLRCVIGQRTQVAISSENGPSRQELTQRAAKRFET